MPTPRPTTNRLVASRVTQEKQLGYYKIRAPFDGIVGDIPVHVGDYVSGTTVLDDGRRESRSRGLHLYSDGARLRRVRMGLGVEILDNSGQLIEHTAIDFISPQVDNQLQGILVKAPVHSSKPCCAPRSW